MDFFFAYKFWMQNLEGLTARREKESELSSLYRVVPTKKCERLKPRAGMNAVSPKILEPPHV